MPCITSCSAWTWIDSNANITNNTHTHRAKLHAPARTHASSRAHPTHLRCATGMPFPPSNPKSREYVNSLCRRPHHPHFSRVRCDHRSLRLSLSLRWPSFRCPPRPPRPLPRPPKERLSGKRMDVSQRGLTCFIRARTRACGKTDRRIALTLEILLVLDGLLHDLLLDPHVLDGVAPDVALGNAPESVAILGCDTTRSVRSASAHVAR